jgi:hypothetical protein
LLAALLTMCVAEVAAAEPYADRRRAHDLAVAGHEALERGDFATAARRYAEAESIVHAPTLLLGLAQAHVGLGKLVEARAEYRRIVVEGVLPGAPAPWLEAWQTARQELAALERRLPAVTVRVDDAHQASVALDGVRLARADVGRPLAVDPGRHEVRVSAPGHHPEVRAFVAREAGSVELVFALRPEPSEAVTQERRPAPRAPAPDASEPSGPPWRAIGVAALVSGGLAAVAGGVTGGLAWRDHTALKTGCPEDRCDGASAGMLDRFHTLATVSTVSFVVAGVALAGGVAALWAAPERDTAPARAAVRPMLGIGAVGATGEF